MSEILNALRADLLDAIDGLDVGRVVSDPRSFTAPCLFIDLPTITRVQTLEVSTITVEILVKLVAPNPGNADAAEWLLARIVPLMEALRVKVAAPSTFDMADRSFASYDLEVTRVLTITPEGS